MATGVEEEGSVLLLVALGDGWGDLVSVGGTSTVGEHVGLGVGLIWGEGVVLVTGVGSRVSVHKEVGVDEKVAVQVACPVGGVLSILPGESEVLSLQSLA